MDRGEDNQSIQGSQNNSKFLCIPGWSSFFRVNASGRGKIKPIDEISCLYKKQCEKGVKILDCVQELFFKCYLGLNNSINSKFKIKAITINYSPIISRVENLFDIFHCSMLLVL